MRIALAGNPNSGKTTMYNALTGRNEKVGNWAGVTVEKKEYAIKKSFHDGTDELIAVDLPGAYSMSPFTSEESITRDYINNEKPDVIINIVDATNLSRSLFFTTQILELGIPVVVALNKSDINEKKHTDIDEEKLSELLSCPVVQTVSTQTEGLATVIEEAVKRVGKTQVSPFSQKDVDLTNKSAVRMADKQRFEFVKQMVSAVEKREVLTKDKNFGDKIDAVLTNKWLGIPIFALVMFLVFDISQSSLGPWLADMLVEGIERFKGFVDGFFGNAHSLLSAILVDGIIGGVGAVLGFLPLVMVMYFLIALLEDCGYMSRVSVVLDPIFKKVGLSGKSVIPFVISTGCTVPGVMACRTIKNDRERQATAMLAPFMPCGAKLPVIALFAGVFFSDASWVGTLMYFVGIILIFLGAWAVNKITGNSKKKSYFIIEMPEYKVPSLKRAALSMLSRGKAYIVKAGTIILVCNTVVQLMQSFTWSFALVGDANADASILASIAKPVSYILIPIIGVASWQMAAAAVTGFIAKENVVGTLAVCYGITNLIDAEGLVVIAGKEQAVRDVFGISAVAGLAILMFNLFTPPCFAAIGAMNSEMKDRKWFFGGIALQFAVGYIIAFLIYQVGTLITEGHFGPGFVYGAVAVALMLATIIYLIIKGQRKVK